MKILCKLLIILVLSIPFFSYADLAEKVEPGFKINYQLGGGFYTAETRPQATPYGVLQTTIFFVEIPRNPSDLKFDIGGVGAVYSVKHEVFFSVTLLSLVIKNHIGINFNFNATAPLTSGFTLMYQF